MDFEFRRGKWKGIKGKSMRMDVHFKQNRGTNRKTLEVVKYDESQR